MKIYLASLYLVSNGRPNVPKMIVNKIGRMKYNMLSFFYINKGCYNKLPEGKKLKLVDSIIKNTDKIMIDSGAYTIQQGSHGTKKILTFDDYKDKYYRFAEWAINRYGEDKFEGFFELDIDERIGLKKVREWRKQLEDRIGKQNVLPVWHVSRKKKAFSYLIDNYDIIGLSAFEKGFTEKHLSSFVGEALKHDCKIHGLGYNNEKIFTKYPFYSVDSSSWGLSVTFYRTPAGNTKLNKKMVKDNWAKAFTFSYCKQYEKQKKYENLWSNYYDL